MAKIGIYAGTFDPVHSGHITFALQSLQAAGLDRVYLLPERRPRGKQHVEHFGHRVAMLKQATQPHPALDVMELVDISFSVSRTLTYLRAEFPDDELVFLFGSDVALKLARWPNSERLIKNNEIVIGLRHKHDRQAVHQAVEGWPVQPGAVTIFDGWAPGVSSGKVRQALRLRKPTDGLLKSVERYSDRHWLYVSLT